MVRITEDIKKEMIAMRQSGSTYAQICSSLGVSKERCIAYLKDIIPDRTITSAMTNEWRAAEDEAPEILKQMGFKNIHNLNAICSFAPSWDYLAEKECCWWLIDVTINGHKSISAKGGVAIEGYEHAILLKSDSEWKLIRFSMCLEQTLIRQSL